MVIYNRNDGLGTDAFELQEIRYCLWMFTCNQSKNIVSGSWNRSGRYFKEDQAQNTCIFSTEFAD
jgi:hypothetical protein